MTESSKPPNKDLERFIEKTTSSIRDAKNKYNYAKHLINNTPIQIKILNIAVPFSLTYLFTYVYYNLTLSIIFALITTVVMGLMTKMIAIIFIILYTVVIINVARQRKITIGSPILLTDIVKSKSPYNCLNQSLTVQSNQLDQDLYGGYFTYSFWLYINNDSDTTDGNWYNYRNTEWKSIFYRGNPIDDSGDLSSLIQFPGFWLTPVLNNMVIVFQNGSYVERLEINDIPFNKWTNYAVVVEAKSVSIYINGFLDKTINLYQPITIMNNYNLYLTSDINASTNKQSGFAGSLAELIFFNYALTSYDINKSYNYYKKIINAYQTGIKSKNTYNIPGLITNSDYLA
jgi:hypothetical protein